MVEDAAISEWLYPENDTLKSTRPSGSGDLTQPFNRTQLLRIALDGSKSDRCDARPVPAQIGIGLGLVISLVNLQNS